MIYCIYGKYIKREKGQGEGRIENRELKIEI
jgi:hypothetical protein